MLDITSHNTKGFDVEAKRSRGPNEVQWIEVSVDGGAMCFFFNTMKEFDDALRKLQSLTPPEERPDVPDYELSELPDPLDAPYELPPPPEPTAPPISKTRNLDDEVPF